MRLAIESTEHVTEVNGVPARVWEGETERGVKVICLITRVAVQDDLPPGMYAEFERELQACRPPSVDATQVFPTRLIL